MQSGIQTQILQASAAQTVTNNSQAVGTIEFRDVIAYINITAISGTTPTLTVKLQDSPDGINWYDTPAVSAALSATGQTRLAQTNIGGYLRAVSTIAGTTPSVTYDIQICGN